MKLGQQNFGVLECWIVLSLAGLIATVRLITWMGVGKFI